MQAPVWKLHLLSLVSATLFCCLLTACNKPASQEQKAAALVHKFMSERTTSYKPLEFIIDTNKKMHPEWVHQRIINKIKFPENDTIMGKSADSLLESEIGDWEDVPWKYMFDTSVAYWIIFHMYVGSDVFRPEKEERNIVLHADKNFTRILKSSDRFIRADNDSSLTQ